MILLLNLRSQRVNIFSKIIEKEIQILDRSFSQCSTFSRASQNSPSLFIAKTAKRELSGQIAQSGLVDLWLAIWNATRRHARETSRRADTRVSRRMLKLAGRRTRAERENRCTEKKFRETFSPRKFCYSDCRHSRERERGGRRGGCVVLFGVDYPIKGETTILEIASR